MSCDKWNKLANDYPGLHMIGKTLILLHLEENKH